MKATGPSKTSIPFDTFRRGLFFQTAAIFSLRRDIPEHTADMTYGLVFWFLHS
jgi:hypothetical protein